jgi:hypothetical protein
VSRWEDAVKQQQQATQSDTDRNAKIIQRAIEIMAKGHYGWSWALAKARAEVYQKEQQ